MVLICMSVIASDAKYPFVCSFANIKRECILWWNVSSCLLPIFELGCFLNCWVLTVLYIVYIRIFYLILLTTSSAEQKFFILMKSNLPIFFLFMDHALVSYLIILHQALGSNEFPSKSVIVLYFPFKSVIHFVLIFV